MRVTIKGRFLNVVERKFPDNIAYQLVVYSGGSDVFSSYVDKETAIKLMNLDFGDYVEVDIDMYRRKNGSYGCKVLEMRKAS